MRVLSELEPKNVFSFFEDICNIPHPSYKEEKISNYLVEFAKARNLEYLSGFTLQCDYNKGSIKRI